jgi:hypothetical protein
MSTRRPHRLLAGLHARIVLGLLVAAVLFRSLIPTGFMPDSAALRDGRLELALCSSAGTTSTITVDLSQGHHPDHGASHDSSPAATDTCPYWTAAHLALDLPPPLVMPALASAHAAPIVAFAQRSLPPLPALGPPLGPRAPPSLLG